MNELVCGSVGTGKTTYIRELIDSRINHKEHSMVLSNRVCKNIYWKCISDLMESVCETDLCITNENNTPSSFATYIVNRYLSRTGRLDNMCLVIDEFNFDKVNSDYKLEAYYDAIADMCKANNISTVFTYNCGDIPKELAFESVPKRMIKTADRVTFLKTR